MKARKLNCPYCDAVIDVNVEGRSNVFCNYCGQQIILDDEKQEYTYNKNINVNKNININKTVHNRYTDDADVIRAQNEAAKDSRDFKQILILMGILIAIPLCIFLGLHLNKSVAQNNGKINAGFYRDLLGEDYKTVEAHFEAAGFTNIELIDLDDSGIAFWNNGKVETISIGGNTSFDSGDWFDPDTKVIISYH